jgi:hypothetical protein
MARRRRTPEHDLQRWVASYLARALQPPVYWTSVDAGAGKLTRTAAGNAKARGCKAGLPDILVFVPVALKHASVEGPEATCVIGLELKAAKGQLSLPQLSTQAELKAAGVRCHVARSLDDVERILEAEGVPRRARIWGSGIRRVVTAIGVSK